MEIRIGHARYDENGKIQGTKSGDNTGKEICTMAWYSGGWNVYLEPLDDVMAKNAATYMEQICANDKYGYSQPNRWTGHNSIVKNGKKVAGGSGDYDCSSLVLSCYILAGLNIAADGYTGNMKNILVGTGKFKAYTDADHVNTDAYAKRGGIYLKEGSHVVMALNSKKNETYAGKGIGTATANSEMSVRSGAGTNKKYIGYVKKGDTVEVLSILSNGWYKIVWPDASCGFAYTSNAGGKYYTYKAKGQEALTPVAAKGYNKSLAGTYKTTACLNMRAVPGVLEDDNIIQEIPKGAAVQNYGYYNTVNGVKWLYIAYNGKVGYSSSKYLSKQ